MLHRRFQRLSRTAQAGSRFASSISATKASKLPVLTTVAAFRSQTANLPSFELSLKGLLGRIAEALKTRRAAAGKENLSNQFFIRGAADEQRIHDFLTPPRLERLRLYVNRYRLTCNPEWVFIYRPGIKIKAKRFFALPGGDDKNRGSIADVRVGYAEDCSWRRWR